MDAAQWPKAALVYDFHKGIGLVNQSEANGNIVGSNSPSSHSKQERKKSKLTKPDQALNCPRCNSTNTKFCYYNNYNPTQSRYLCKGCRRYWTHGGTLRNVPVGGSSRKKIKPSLAPPLSNPSKLFLDLNPNSTPMSSRFLATEVPLSGSFIHDFKHDLNMGFYHANNVHYHFLPLPQNFELSASHGEALTTYPSSGFHFQGITKPTLNLCMDGGIGGTTSTTHGRSDIGGMGRIMSYPFGDQLKQDSTTSSPGDRNDVLDQSNGHTRDNSIGGHVRYLNNHYGLYN